MATDRFCFFVYTLGLFAAVLAFDGVKKDDPSSTVLAVPRSLDIQGHHRTSTTRSAHGSGILSPGMQALTAKPSQHDGLAMLQQRASLTSEAVGHRFAEAGSAKTAHKFSKDAEMKPKNKSRAKAVQGIENASGKHHKNRKARMDCGDEVDCGLEGSHSRIHRKAKLVDERIVAQDPHMEQSNVSFERSPEENRTTGVTDDLRRNKSRAARSISGHPGTESAIQNESLQTIVATIVTDVAGRLRATLRRIERRLEVADAKVHNLAVDAIALSSATLFGASVAFAVTVAACAGAIVCGVVLFEKVSEDDDPSGRQSNCAGRASRRCPNLFGSRQRHDGNATRWNTPLSTISRLTTGSRSLQPRVPAPDETAAPSAPESKPRHVSFAPDTTAQSPYARSRTSLAATETDEEEYN